MSLRSQLIQIILLLVVLIVGSFVARPGLPVALMEVRLPLVLVLAVALGYFEFQRRLNFRCRPLVQQDNEAALRERYR